MIAFKLLGMDKPLMFTLAFLVMPVLAALVGRPLWNWWATRWRKRLTDLLDMLREEAEVRALQPGPSPEPGDS